MSHKFHGKGSGVRKTEKRLKKLMEEVVCIYCYILGIRLLGDSLVAKQ